METMAKLGALLLDGKRVRYSTTNTEDGYLQVPIGMNLGITEYGTKVVNVEEALGYEKIQITSQKPSETFCLAVGFRTQNITLSPPNYWSGSRIQRRIQTPVPAN